MAVIFITGASSGIGEASALHLLRQGHHVIASMRNPSRDAELLVSVAQEENVKLDIIQLDVNDPESSEIAVKELLNRFGHIDVLINNAGIAQGSSTEETSEDILRAMFETNFFGAMRLTRLLLPSMRQARSGKIINITSIAAVLGFPLNGGYASSKAALEMASEALAQEVRRFNIHIVLVEPGCVLTPIFNKARTEPNPDSPYIDFDHRMGRLLSARLKKPTLPERVAETIQSAIASEAPNFRYLVGEDAIGWEKGRKTLSDEQWIDSGQEMSLDDYANWHHQTFGIKI